VVDLEPTFLDERGSTGTVGICVSHHQPLVSGIIGLEEEAEALKAVRSGGYFYRVAPFRPLATPSPGVRRSIDPVPVKLGFTANTMVEVKRASRTVDPGVIARIYVL